ncbi:NUDIX hydrolase [Jiangella gansuensis]|uniref:NUDIX hydrolase n=1 Tax=Jiangella gansuensis TaxID=281473 RepID=UPI0004B264B0|nr:NUDIX hydrolase [Jiangella gansuensis]
MSPRRGTVVAAGAVMWRTGKRPGDLEICLVHRPKYDDWSLPKGKVDRGEHPLAAAAREVWEETGHQVRLGRRLPTQGYDVAGRPKLVHYWLAEADATAGPREPDDEVDEVVFLPVEDALQRLTYERDADLARAALAAPVRTTPLVLLRHAQAVRRPDWSGPDIERPLSASGQRQAAALVPVLAALAPSRVLSSDAVRCVDTVRPYARQHRVTLELEPSLAEESLRTGSAAQPTGDLIRTLLADGPALVCSHRPLLPVLFEAAGAEPGDTLEPSEFAVLHHDDDGAVVAVDRHRLDAA